MLFNNNNNYYYSADLDFNKQRSPLSRAILCNSA